MADTSARTGQNTTFATNFLSREQADELARVHGAPLYVYSRGVLLEQAKKALSIPAPYGLTVRYAMKANSHPEILKTLRGAGVKIDASSSYEAELAIEQGFAPQDILLTSQQLAHNLHELGDKGVQFTACSLHQLEAFGGAFPGGKVSVRLNPGLGSGATNKQNTGGITSSFGIWHEYVPQVLEIAQKYNLTIERLHTHIGSGTDPAKWVRAIDLTLELAEKLPTVTIVNLGGGFKVGRMDDEPSTDLQVVGECIVDRLHDFAERTGRELPVEIEPGTFMVANVGILLAQVDDVTDTGSEGYKFIKLNTGMSEFLRSALYAAQHPIAVLGDNVEEDNFVVVGHCCESADLFTPDPYDPTSLATRHLVKPDIGNTVLIGGCGAYAASLSAKDFNAFPRAKEVVID